MNIDVRIVSEDNTVVVTGYPVAYDGSTPYRMDDEELFRVEIPEEALMGYYRGVEWFAHTSQWSDVPFSIRPYIDQYL